MTLVARSATDVQHPNSISDERDFRVTDRGGIFPVHASRKRTRVWRVRAVQPPQPIESAGRLLAAGLLERSAAYFLGHGFVKTG
jgi:hypothetical protein